MPQKVAWWSAIPGQPRERCVLPFVFLTLGLAVDRRVLALAVRLFCVVALLARGLETDNREDAECDVLER